VIRELLRNASLRSVPQHMVLPPEWLVLGVNGSTEIGRLRAALIKAGGLLPACTRCCSAF
jgi:hypothetical protein